MRVPSHPQATCRAADLSEEVARIFGLDKLPTTLPAREAAVGRLTPSQRLRRRIEDALRDRGLYEVVAWSFTASETIERLRLGEVPLLRLSNPLSEDQSVMRPLLLPGLLDAARRNAAYDRPGASYFESAHVYRLTGPLDAPEGSPGGRIPAAERHHVAVLVPDDFFAAKGVLEGLLHTVRLPFELEPGERAFLHPGRAASVLAGGERKIGWIGELHPLVARDWSLPGGRPSSSTPTRSPRSRRGPALPARLDVPGGRPGHRGRRGRGRPAADVEDAVHAAAASCSSACGSSTSTAASRSAGAGSRLRCGSSSGRRTGRSPTTRSPPCAPRSSASSRGSAGSPVARVAVVGASGFAGALCASLVERHPRLELDVVTARGDAGRRLSDLYPRYRVDRKLETFDADLVAEGCDAALVAYPHGASAPVVEELRTRGVKVVDLSADFRVPLELYERWYGPHPAPKLLDEAVYGLTELKREKIRGAGLVAAPGCYPTAALLALVPLRELAEDAFVDAKSGVSGAGREATETTHFVSVAENVKPYKVEGHVHQAELDAYFGPATFVPHLVPIDQGLMASCYVRPSREMSADEVHAFSRTPTATTRSSRCRFAAGSARRARHQPLPHPRHAVNGTVMCSRRSTTSGRAPPARPCRT